MNHAQNEILFSRHIHTVKVQRQYFKSDRDFHQPYRLYILRQISPVKISRTITDFTKFSPLFIYFCQHLNNHFLKAESVRGIDFYNKKVKNQQFWENFSFLFGLLGRKRKINEAHLLKKYFFFRKKLQKPEIKVNRHRYKL